VNELNRILSEHPVREQNNIIRYNRLLGQLMPLRAFGDFGYKWEVSRIKSVGLTKAFGPHVIPPFYLTPPYLTCEPEVTHYDLSQLPQNADSFVILATDGLWEQFESSRIVADHLWKHRTLKQGVGEESSLEHEDTIDLPVGEAEMQNQDHEIDSNRATFLLRSALSQPITDHDQRLSDAEQRKHDHQKLVSILTLPPSVVRNFRDDISLIVVRL
jgi:pyruvate dehydrogenase phosphatase